MSRLTLGILCGRLLEVLRTLGPFKEEPKKTSIHLVNTSGFAGVHPRKSFLYLNVRNRSRARHTRSLKLAHLTVAPLPIILPLWNWSHHHLVSRPRTGLPPQWQCGTSSLRS